MVLAGARDCDEDGDGDCWLRCWSRQQTELGVELMTGWSCLELGKKVMGYGEAGRRSYGWLWLKCAGALELGFDRGRKGRGRCCLGFG